jgi:phosphoserine phosphatase
LDTESSGIDLKRSFAYGNHEADLPLLDCVGYPHVVEPSSILHKMAVARKWPILTYR